MPKKEMSLEEWARIEAEDPILQEIDKEITNQSIKEICYPDYTIDWIVEQKQINNSGGVGKVLIETVELKTKRQKQVYRLMVKRLNQEEIADKLGITQQAVSKINRKIFHKKL
jgi:DNA-binding NarL/FixJ family response regulator